jgi:hypothetical protein
MSSPQMMTMFGGFCWAAAGPALQASAPTMATKIPVALRMIPSTVGGDGSEATRRQDPPV